MSLEFLKSLLDYPFYDKHKMSITQDFVPREYYDLYETIIKSHTENKTSLTVESLKALHKANHPVMSRAKEEALEPLYRTLRETITFDPKIQDSIINTKLCQRISDEIATIAIDISSGNEDRMADLQTLMDKLKKVRATPEELIDHRKITIDLFKAAPENIQWKFNYPDLQERLKGFGGGYAGVIAARPDTGKTSFYMSLVCAPSGFIAQGAKVHIIGNEESPHRLKVRALSALTGLDGDSVEAEFHDLFIQYERVLENLFIIDGLDMTIEMLDNYCHNNKVDILIIDQLDQLGVRGKHATNEERLRLLYIKARELAKRNNCGVICVCQAGFTAHNKLHYGFECLDGSKTGKGAACDWCITIGMELQPGGIDNYFRMANLPKNKMTGRKQPVQFVLNPDICRIHA